MKWPGQRALEDRIGELEVRADSSYTDALVAAITANAGGTSTAFPTATSALESCAGFVQRSFASSEVRADERTAAVLDPITLGMIGRTLIRKGELVMLISTEGGRLRLLPGASHDVGGGGDPDTWTYRVTVGGPEKTNTYEKVAAASVLHFRYSQDPETPWRGAGPLQVARLAGRLSAETTAALADEASGPRGSFMPIPKDGDDPTIGHLRADAKNAKGSMLFTESGDWDASGGGRYAGWTQRRFGADPPAGLIELMKRASMEVFAACGISASLFDDSDGTSKREGYRQALHSVIAPLGRAVAYELSSKLDDPVVLDWLELRAGDISGRARAFQSMVGGGMDIAKAAALSGLMMD